MYIKKITKIQNVGKFHKAGVSGGEYAKYTLFYGGNGRGKTTLCAILRSLKSGSAVILADRQTLGEPAAPDVQILLDKGVAQFTTDKWNTKVDGLHVFDGAFVTDNVHAGEEVGTDHRRSLYRVIVGPKGVQLAEEIDALDAQVTDLTAKIGAEKKVIQQHVPTGMTVEKFLALPDDLEVTKKILEQQKKIKAATQATDIAGKPLLTEQAFPELPDAFLPLIEKTIAGISADAAQKIDEHLAKHKFGDGGEGWIATGLQHIHEASCPFCATSLQGNALIALYRQFFDESYADFKAQLIVLREETEKALSEASALKTENRFKDLEKAVEFWRAFGTVDFTPPPSLDVLSSRLAAVSEAALAIIDAKIASPLDKVKTDALDSPLADWAKSVEELKTCNDSLAKANIAVQAIKAAVENVGKVALEKELATLLTTQKRFSPPVVALVSNYMGLQGSKTSAAASKEAKKNELDAYDASVLPKYHDAINEYLVQFGAGFSLKESEKTYEGKKPQWIYTIDINKHAVDVTTRPGGGMASFQTAMSAGDRSTLALAFFLAQLKLDPDLKDAVVVFDDPFTSLDEFRRVMTAKTIFRIGQTASQVIVFSHDKYFLEDVHSKVIGANCATFQISSTKKNSSIETWDLVREVKEGYLKDHMELQEFHDGHTTDAKAMRTLMRPLLEKYIRYRFPNQIPDGKWLGDMLGIIKADPAHPLTAVYNDIDDINQYTAPFHHDPNEPFDADEVRAFVGRTLAVVGGC